MPTTRSQSKKFDAAQIPAVGQSNIEATFHSMIEWMVFDYSETAAVKRVNWKEFLNEIRGVEGCSHITFACPKEDPEILWVIIEWLSVSHRNNFYKADGIATTAKKFLCYQSEEFYSSYRIEYGIGPVILARYRSECRDDKYIYEIWMAYFPVHALGAEKKRESQLPSLMNFYDRDEEPYRPMSGIRNQEMVWLFGEVIYQGVQCQRIVWFLVWRSDEAEELYKTKAQWGWEGKGKARKPKLLLNIFIDELKSIGMVGYKAWHADFLEIIPPLGI